MRYCGHSNGNTVNHKYRGGLIVVTECDLMALRSLELECMRNLEEIGV